jgi:hypothetical protein
MAYNAVELHNNIGGYFPLGVNRMWHGGVHLNGPSDALVRAPFSGEIVAARLDHDVEKNQGHFGALSFILLRQELSEHVYAQLQQGAPDSQRNDAEEKWRGKSVGQYVGGQRGPKPDNPPDLVAEVKRRLAACEDDAGVPYYAPTPPALVKDGQTIDEDFVEAIVAFQTRISTGWAPDGIVTVPKTTWKALERRLAQQGEAKKKGTGEGSSQGEGDKPSRDLYCLFMHLRAEPGLASAEGRVALAEKLPWLSRVRLPLTEAEKQEQAEQEEQERNRLEERERKRQEEEESTAEELEYALKTTVGHAVSGTPKYNGAADVEWVKRRLGHLGFDPKSTDGAFTPELKSAIVAFQERHVPWFQKKNKKGDGIIGPQGFTQEALRKTRVEIDGEREAAGEDEKAKGSATDLDSKFAEALEKRSPGDLASVISHLGVQVPAGEPLWQLSAIPVAPSDGSAVPEAFAKPFIHWELFSRDPMVKSWEILEDDGDSVISEDELPIVTLIEEREGIGKYDFLDAKKIRAFFKSDRSSFLRRTQVRFRSEWDVDVDKTVGIIRQKGYSVEGLKEQLLPYLWWAEAKEVLPKSSSVWHYHPIGFLEKLFSYSSAPKSPDKTPDLPADNVDKVYHEVILVVGEEQLNQTHGNKLRFPAHAVREIRERYSSNYDVTILMFEGGYTQAEIDCVERSAQLHNPNAKVIPISSTAQLIDYINTGTTEAAHSAEISVSPRSYPNANGEVVLVWHLQFFSHGLPSRITFEPDARYETRRTFGFAQVDKLDPSAFDKDATIWSFACRAGNAGPVDDQGFNYAGRDWRAALKVHESLAQKLTDHLRIPVYAFVGRADTSLTWADDHSRPDWDYRKQFVDVYDRNIDVGRNPRFWEDCDEVLWNKQGAYRPVQPGTTPAGIDHALLLFQPARGGAAE